MKLKNGRLKSAVNSLKAKVDTLKPTNNELTTQKTQVTDEFTTQRLLLETRSMELQNSRLVAEYANDSIFAIKLHVNTMSRTLGEMF